MGGGIKIVAEILTKALKSLNIPTSRLVYKGEAETYFTFQKVMIRPDGYADDDNTLDIHIFRVDLYSKNDYTRILAETREVLKSAGFTISSVDSEQYENDTGFYHVPITLNYMEVK